MLKPMQLAPQTMRMLGSYPITASSPAVTVRRNKGDLKADAILSHSCRTQLEMSLVIALVTVGNCSSKQDKLHKPGRLQFLRPTREKAYL